MKQKKTKLKQCHRGFEKRKKIELPPAFERELPAVRIAPDSFFYRFKKFFEGVDIFFTFDDVAKAEKYIKYAELRLAEAKEMAEKGKPEFVDKLIEENEDNLERGNEILKIARQVGKNVTRLTELVAVATSIHEDILENVLEKVPEQAKPAVQRAIASSERGNEEALNSLEKDQPEKAAEIHFRIAEKRLARAKEKVGEGEVKEVEDLIKEYEDRINKSNKIAEIAKGLGKNTTNVEQLVAEVTPTHLEILSEIHEKVPEQAKTAIEKAMDVSTKEREKAVEALKEKGSLGEIPEKVPIPEEVKEKIPSIAKSKIPTTIPTYGSEEGKGEQSSTMGSSASSGRRP